jgi:NAD(P)-dependent dehydrogenase (short-subunit alcohol dehydrogenase family)
MREQFDLKGKVAIITGSSKGIGAAMAHGLAAHGAKVVVSSRDQAAVNAVAEEIKKLGFEATGIACHVGDEAQLSQLVEKTIATYGGVDILINNAAINPTFGPLADTELGAFDKIMSVNLRSCFILSNLCLPSMKERGGGSIINIASVEGLKPSQGLGPYSVSKAALIMLTKSQAKEWGAFGVRSNAVCPGLVQTKLSAGLWQNEKILDSITKHLPSGRMAQPEEMSGLAIFLASEASSYCTGGVYTADGGYMIA